MKFGVCIDNVYRKHTGYIERAFTFRYISAKFKELLHIRALACNLIKSGEANNGS